MADVNASLAGVSIILCDGSLIVVDKPAGLLSAPGLGPDNADNLLSRLQEEYPDARLAHRLDRDTSGLMIFARGPAAQRALSLQFERCEIQKRYFAVVWAQLAGSLGRIELPMRKDLENPPRQCIDHALGKPAVTEWRVVNRWADRTRVELAPLTGRSHQLRLHLTAVGHPILGDPLYGTETSRQLAPRLLLHAHGLRFRHPTTGVEISLRHDAPF